MNNCILRCAIRVSIWGSSLILMQDCEFVACGRDHDAGVVKQMRGMGPLEIPMVKTSPPFALMVLSKFGYQMINLLRPCNMGRFVANAVKLRRSKVSKIKYFLTIYLGAKLTK